jgi:hypothetical protein
MIWKAIKQENREIPSQNILKKETCLLQRDICQEWSVRDYGKYPYP